MSRNLQSVGIAERLADDTTGLRIGGMVAVLVDSIVIQGPNVVLA